MKARSSYHGYQLVPHLSGGYDFNYVGRKFTGVVEPYASFDWVFNSEGGFSEHGAYPFNITMKNRTSSMLRSEIGVSGYESWKGSWGTLILREGLSYVNKKPFHIGRITSSFVGAPGSFTVESFTNCQNLFSPSFEIFFRTDRRGFLSLSYEGEYGAGYSSSEVTGEIGVYF